jgi:hypothetical protein
VELLGAGGRRLEEVLELDVLGGAPELVDLVGLEDPGWARGRDERARTVGCLDPERGELDLLKS